MSGVAVHIRVAGEVAPMADPYRQPSERPRGPRWGATLRARLYAKWRRRTTFDRKLERLIATMIKQDRELADIFVAIDRMRASMGDTPSESADE